MKRYFSKFNSRLLGTTTVFLLLLLFIIGILVITSLLLPSTTFASRLNRAIQSSIPLSKEILARLPNVTPSPTIPNTTVPGENTPSTQDSQAQQTLITAQNDVNTADTIIYWSSFLLALFSAIVIIAGVVLGALGVGEFRRIRKLRSNLEKYVKNVTTVQEQITIVQAQVKERNEQLEQLTKNSESKIKTIEELHEKLSDRHENESKSFEERIEQLTKDFENQRSFLEAPYFFGVATEAYKLGDNERAIDYYLQVLKLRPNDVNIMERLGRAYSNLDKLQEAIDSLEEGRSREPLNIPILRSLALTYRYSDPEKAIEYLRLALDRDPNDYKGLDFLGLFYRDQDRIDEAISCHEKALSIKQRPETEFFLSILYLRRGDKEKAKSMAKAADEHTYEKEHDERLRPVWKVLIHCAVPITNGNIEEGFRIFQTLAPYITTDRTYRAVASHIQFLLEGTGQEKWKPQFMEIIKLPEIIGLGGT